jgi:hypothetical protein
VAAPTTTAPAVVFRKSRRCMLGIVVGRLSLVTRAFHHREERR